MHPDRPAHRKPLMGGRKENPVMHAALTRHLKLASVRDMDWVTAHFGYR